jgi:sec-independent protein translocase protein TatA
MFEGLFQPMHLLVIAVAFVFLAGPKKIPELAKGLGEGIRGFKSALNDSEKPDPPSQG